MIDRNLSNLHGVSVHAIGNRGLEEGIVLSDEPLYLADDKLVSLLRTYFLSNFTTPEYHTFTFSNEDFTLNPLFQFARDVFQDEQSLHENSVNIAQHLYQVSQHPNIKAGDLYVALMSNVIVDQLPYMALGIFKSENKDTYLKLKRYTSQFDLGADEGVNIKKLDKGCLILNTAEEEGFKVLIVDNANKGDAQFWKDDFLNVKPWSDAFHHTHNFMNLTRQYVGDQLHEEFRVSKADKIDLLNRSMEFFKSREQFNQAEFETEVLNDASVIESFRNYEKSFMANSDMDIVDNFEISASAVKRQARVFKSVLKLDKNFHVYIHGNRELIEKGFDEVMGKHYYKLYFDNES